jgi:hypothetical protein
MPAADGDGGAAPAAPAPIVSAIACKLPTFWSSNPKQWFRTAESNFHVSGISSEVTRYHHVIKSLTSDVVSELEDVLDDQSTADNYTALKAIILERFTSTTEEKLRRLVSQEAMGDRTPSQFLRHLQSLSDKNAQDKLLRTLWVDKLPPQLQTVVAQHPELAIADVAKIADSVHGVLKMQPPLCATTSAPSTDANSTSDPALQEVLRRLEVLEVRSRAPERYRGDDQQQSGRRSNSRSQTRERVDSHPTCWYHRTHGEKAKRCKKPCDYHKTSAAASPAFNLN